MYIMIRSIVIFSKYTSLLFSVIVILQHPQDTTAYDRLCSASAPSQRQLYYRHRPQHSIIHSIRSRTAHSTAQTHTQQCCRIYRI